MYVVVWSLTEEGFVTEGVNGDAGGHGPAEEGEEMDGGVGLEPVIVEGLGLTATFRWRKEFEGGDDCKKQKVCEKRDSSF